MLIGIVMLIFASLTVHATEKKHGYRSSSPHTVDSHSDSSSVSRSVSKSEGGDAVAESGDSSSHSSVGDVRGGDSGSSVGDVTVSTKHRKPVPSVFIGSPDTTAPCWVGVSGGGSGSGWGASGLFARRDRACLAMLQFHNLAKLGLHLPAATAYCEERANLWKPFGSVDQCEALMAQSLIDASIPEEISPDRDTQETSPESEVSVSPKLYTEAEFQVASAETDAALARAASAERIAEEALRRATSAEKAASSAPEAAQRVVIEHEDNYGEVQGKLRAIKSTNEWKRLYEEAAEDE